MPPLAGKIVAMGNAAHLDLDGAWATDLGIDRIDARNWGPRLRYFSLQRDIEMFEQAMVNDLPPFIVYGSGDFHQLAALFARRHARELGEPLTVVSFDNHPDWDVRPPRWSCGAWVNRALESPNISRVSVWGCGNFELAFPSRLFANRAALRKGRLEVHAWAERQSPATSKRYRCMTRGNWRQRFETFAGGLAGVNLYVTVDMDCLNAAEADTQWENGLFTAEDISWAIGSLRDKARIVAGDLCGARSEPVYARRFQRLAAWWDHPKLSTAPSTEGVNLQSFQRIWPVLVGA